MKHYIIAGGGVAGVTAAKEIKKLDPEAAVDVYCSEDVPYYYRPRLWEFIAGRIASEDTYYRPADWYAAQGIGLHLGTAVVAVDPQAHSVTLSDGSIQAYDRLLIAAGSSSFVPPVAGTELEGVYALRSLADARTIVARAEQAKTAVLIGGGLLGLETAKALADRGLQVTVVEFFPRLLPRQLDEEGAAVLEAHLLHLGMKLITGDSVTSIEGDHHGLRLVLKTGSELTTDMVVFSAGIRSNLQPWASCGIETGRGVKVNPYMETNQPDILAAGDVAEFEGMVYGIIPAATEQGGIAGSNMVNPRSMTYTGTLPSTKLKVAGMEFSSFGESTAEGDGVRVLRRSQPEDGKYLRLALRDHILIGAIVLGEPKTATAIKKIIAAGVDVRQWEEQMLADRFDFSQVH
ncbi:MAG: NAD(P)/FAD-dependent oxidoreductase [Anaerolineae bacterium]|nr:NAD(P)/FAD-dependent oxidoreductase [Anaerolineae bacterium]